MSDWYLAYSFHSLRISTTVVYKGGYLKIHHKTVHDMAELASIMHNLDGLID